MKTEINLQKVIKLMMEKKHINWIFYAATNNATTAIATAAVMVAYRGADEQQEKKSIQGFE